MRAVFMILPVLLAFLAPDSGAFAAEGMAKPWQLNFQPAATPVMERLEGLHHYLLILISVITLFVLALLVYVCVKFNAKANPVPSKTTHNTLLEVIWTGIPVLILITIVVPSMKLLYFAQTTPPADMTLKVIGHQWYWEYVYPDHGDFRYDSNMKEDKDLKPGEPRLLAVDNAVVVPVGAVVRVQTTAVDVIHSWAVPSFGVKMDAVPGRLQEGWFKVERPGTYYGQCSELCGVRHGFMPIMVKAVEKVEFDQWISESQKKFAAKDYHLASSKE